VPLSSFLHAADFEFALRLEPHNKELLREYSTTRETCQREAKLLLPATTIRLPIQIARSSPKTAHPDTSETTSASGQSQTKASGEPRASEVKSKTGKESPCKTFENMLPSVSELPSQLEPVLKTSENRRGLSVGSPTTSRPNKSVPTRVGNEAEQRSEGMTEVSTSRNARMEDERAGPPHRDPVSNPSKAAIAGQVQETPEPRVPDFDLGSPSRTRGGRASPGVVKSQVLPNGSLAAAAAAAGKLQRALAENVSAPRTSYEFETQWKGFKEDTVAKAKLLKVNFM
jgi:hypothetical protein